MYCFMITRTLNASLPQRKIIAVCCLCSCHCCAAHVFQRFVTRRLTSIIHRGEKMGTSKDKQMFKFLFVYTAYKKCPLLQESAYLNTSMHQRKMFAVCATVV
jgi:hypothetical protein